MTQTTREVANDDASPKGAPDSGEGRRSRRSLGLDRFSGLYVWIALIVVFSFWLPETFPTSATLRSVADDQAVTVIVAIALLVPVAAGAFDLTVAANLGLSALLVTWMQSQGLPPAAAIALTLCVGVVVGAANGFVVTRLHVDSFIATLGMSSVLGALTFWIVKGQPVVSGIDADFVAAARTQVFGIPMTVIYMAIIACIVWYLMEMTPFGRYLYATGGNQEAARLAGVRTDRMVMYAMMLSGLLSSLAGVVLGARLGIGSPDAGPPYLLPAFCAVFLGATQFKVGRVNVAGTILAVCLLATGVKGLQLAGSPSYVKDLFNGVALIVAVALAMRSARRRRGARK